MLHDVLSPHQEGQTFNIMAEAEQKAGMHGPHEPHGLHRSHGSHGLHGLRAWRQSRLVIAGPDVLRQNQWPTHIELCNEVIVEWADEAGGARFRHAHISSARKHLPVHTNCSPGLCAYAQNATILYTKTKATFRPTDNRFSKWLKGGL